MKVLDFLSATTFAFFLVMVSTCSICSILPLHQFYHCLKVFSIICMQYVKVFCIICMQHVTVILAWFAECLYSSASLEGTCCKHRAGNSFSLVWHERPWWPQQAVWRVRIYCASVWSHLWFLHRLDHERVSFYMCLLCTCFSLLPSLW